MPLHVLRHVKADQFNAHDLRQLPADFRLADTGGTREQERTNWLLMFVQSGARQLDCSCQGINCLVLSKHDHLEIAFKIFQSVNVRAGHMLRRNLGDTGNNFFHVSNLDHLLALALRKQTLGSTSFINDVDRLVRHVAVIDVTSCQFRGGFQGAVAIAQVVMFFEA